MSLALAREAPARARRVLVLGWAACIALLAVAAAAGRLEPSGRLTGNLAGVAALLFILVPERWLHRAGEGWTDLGLPWWGWRDRRTWAAWARGLLTAAATCAVVFPLFLALFWAFTRALGHLPRGLAGALVPYGAAGRPHLRLPPGLALSAALQLLVVALPEELFYRGWMQTTWRESDPARGVRVLGARLGRGFVATQALFALGHLVGLQPWRVATFFPGLLFGWLRERTGGLAAPVLVHAASNLFLLVLEASFYG